MDHLAAVDPWPRRADLRASAVALVAVGYLVLHKSFAYVGMASASLFVGELTIVLSFTIAGVRRQLLVLVRALTEPGPLHLLGYALTALTVYGAILAGRGLAAGRPGQTVLRVFVFNAYPVAALVIGLWAARTDRLSPRRLFLVLAWVNGLGGTLFLLFIDRLALVVPGSGGVRLNLGNGSVFALVGLLSFAEPLMRRWPLYLLNGFVLLAAQSRAEWLALGAVLVVWGLLAGRLRHVAVGLLAATLLLAAVASLRIQLPTASTRGGEVSVAGVVGRVVATVDRDLASRFSDQAADFSGTASWRTEWWKAIWNDARADATTSLVGHGYGFPINRLVTHVEDDVRTPHSVFFFALGYGGWAGVGFIAVFHLVLGRALLLSSRVSDTPFGVLTWIAALGIGMFSNWFEAPFGAFPTYLILGMALAPLLDGASVSRAETAITRPGLERALVAAVPAPERT